MHGAGLDLAGGRSANKDETGSFSVHIVWRQDEVMRRHDCLTSDAVCFVVS